MSIIVVLLLFCVLGRTQPRPQPEAGGANLPVQEIGANDLIDISVYDAPELTRTVRVGADGMLSLPMLRRQIEAAGLLPVKLETAIAGALREEDLILHPIVTVHVAEYQSRPVSVIGAVKKPLIFQAVGNVTLLDALTRAEGLAPDAGREIVISSVQPGQPGKTVLLRRVSVPGLIERADPALNIQLRGGEEIRVPEAGKIFVVGNVTRPGAFPAIDATVLKTLALSEGLAPFSANEAFIYRKVEAADKRFEIAVDLKKVLKRQASDVPLMADDIFYVPDNSGRRAGLAALEKALLFGSTAGATALVYGRVR
jgi:polysaccharide biosynthesis/export protein